MSDEREAAVAVSQTVRLCKECEHHLHLPEIMHFEEKWLCYHPDYVATDYMDGSPIPLKCETKNTEGKCGDWEARKPRPPKQKLWWKLWA